MNSGLFWVGVALVCPGVLASAIGGILITISIYRQQKIESTASTEDIKSHVTSQLTDTTDAILVGLKERNQTLQSKLREKYQLGYIFFGVRGPELKDIVFRPGGAVMNADWYATKIVLDTQHKVAQVTIPNPNWKQTSSTGKTVVNGNAIWTGEYALGKPVELRFAVHMVGQPTMYLEVIDDAGSVATCVIGFK